MENITDLEQRQKFREQIKNLSLEARKKIWEERQGIKLPLPPPPPDPLGYAIYCKVTEGQKPKGECPICESIDIETFIEKNICGNCETPEETIECSRQILEAMKKYIAGNIDDEEFENIVDDVTAGRYEGNFEEEIKQLREECPECVEAVGVGFALNFAQDNENIDGEQIFEDIDNGKLTIKEAMDKIKKEYTGEDLEFLEHIEKDMGI